MSDLSSLTAFILAGGLGTRLRPVVSDRPKVLAEVGGRPFLAYLLDQLAEAGVRDVVLGTGHLATAVSDAFGAAYRNLPLTYSTEVEPRGTGGALRLALPLLRTESALVMNGDSYFDCDLRTFAQFFESRPRRAALLMAQVPEVRPFGQVHLDPDDQVTRFEEKGGAVGPGWINAGIYLFRHEVIEAIPPDRAVSLEREVFSTLLGRGLYGCRQHARFLDVGTPESYEQAERFFAISGRPTLSFGIFPRT